jgi:hypothetical protein
MRPAIHFAVGIAGAVVGAFGLLAARAANDRAARSFALEEARGDALRLGQARAEAAETRNGELESRLVLESAALKKMRGDFDMRSQDLVASQSDLRKAEDEIEAAWNTEDLRKYDLLLYFAPIEKQIAIELDQAETARWEFSERGTKTRITEEDLKSLRRRKILAHLAAVALPDLKTAIDRADAKAARSIVRRWSDEAEDYLRRAKALDEER